MCVQARVTPSQGNLATCVIAGRTVFFMSISPLARAQATVSGDQRHLVACTSRKCASNNPGAFGTFFAVYYIHEDTFRDLFKCNIL